MTDISHYTKNLGRVSIIEDEIADTVDSFCMLEEMNIHKKKKEYLSWIPAPYLYRSKC